ncbi:MAG: hypothetical protein L0Y55_15970, partial [Anaerolineales bacterium]|nr:hypothetical protein [Anaerolineales bacterium]
MELNVFGGLTCEDTALVRDRLRALEIAYTNHNREDDARIDEMLRARHNGSIVTPTLVFGDGDIVIAEPTLEQLEATLLAAG